MAELSLSKADPIGGGATVSVWQVPDGLLFPPGINLILITETNAYFLYETKAPLAPGDWVVVGDTATKVGNVEFLAKYIVKADVPIDLPVDLPLGQK